MRDAGFRLVKMEESHLEPSIKIPASRNDRELFNMLDGCWNAVAAELSGRFTTQDYRDILEKNSQSIWAELQRRYGRGGKGSGNYYSPSNILFNFLKEKERDGIIFYVSFVPSRKGWGSPRVAEWSISSVTFCPPSSEEDRELWEGKERLKTHLVRERSQGMRKQVLSLRRAFGLQCEICGLEGKGLSAGVRESLFEVHHSKEPFAGKGLKAIKPADMALLCACCHRVLHQLIRVENRWLLPAEAKAIVGSLR